MCQQESGNTVSWEVFSLKQLLINRFTVYTVHKQYTYYYIVHST